MYRYVTIVEICSRNKYMEKLKAEDHFARLTRPKKKRKKERKKEQCKEEDTLFLVLAGTSDMSTKNDSYV